MIVFPPLMQLFVFIFAATLDVLNVSIAILNRDYGEQAFELVQRFHGSPIFRHITYLKGVEEIQPYIDQQKGLMVVSIDEQFSRNLDSGKNADVQMILDGRKSNSTQIVAGYAQTIITQFSRELETKYGYPQINIALFPRYWFNPNLFYDWFTLTGLLGILVMNQALVVTGLSIAREKELGTFDQLLVSPLLPREILVGKAVPGILISMAQGSLILLAGILVFRVPFTGSFLLLYLSMFVFSCAIVGIGLFFSALCSTQQQTLLTIFVFISPSVLLSGFATPIENMPMGMQYFTYINPLRYFLEITRGSFLKDLPAADVFSNVWPMAIIAVFTLTSATFCFRKRIQ